MNIPSPLDRSLKVLLRRAYPAFLRLARLAVDPARVHLEDVSVNIPEHRSDQLFLLGQEGDPDHCGFHIECQLQPDTRPLGGWYFKNAAFNRQYGIPIPLIVLYLTRGDRATFPDRHIITAHGVDNEWIFHTERLWEHAERIRGGELAELAPLLVLCEDNPTEETLQKERRLILDLDVPRPVRADLLAVAAMVGGRYFGRDLLLAFFREELEMLKEASLVEEWIEEATAQAAARAAAEGEARGEARSARQVLLALLERRFGELPAALIDRVGSMPAAEALALAPEALDAASLEELGLGEPGDTTSE